MIYKEVAIEPAYLSNWDRVRLLVSQFGLDYGRLISDFPSDKWRFLVWRSCANCLPVDRNKIVEYLNSSDAKLINNRRDFREAKTWIENAKRENASLKPFHLVVTCDKHEGIPEFVQGDELHDNGERWKPEMDEIIPRRADDMANIAKELLFRASEVAFIDPNYEPDRSFNKPLQQFIAHAVQGGRPVRMEYHLKDDSSDEYFTGKLKEMLLRGWLRLPQGYGIKFIRWKSFNWPSRDKMHPRYIMTDLGGLSFDYGLDEGNDGETTDVHILAKKGEICKRRLLEFCATSTTYEYGDGFEYTCQGVFKLEIANGEFRRMGLLPI
jgi:hypothetical protein